MEGKEQVPKIITNQEDGSIFVELSKEIYHRDAVLKASAKFSNDYYVHVSPTSEYCVGVIFMAKPDIKADLKSAALNFCNEVLDQQIREDLSKSNGQIRDIIYRHAFSPIKDIEDAL